MPVLVVWGILLLLLLLEYAAGAASGINAAGVLFGTRIDF